MGAPVIPVLLLFCFHVPPTNFSLSSFTRRRRRGKQCIDASRRVRGGNDPTGNAEDSAYGSVRGASSHAGRGGGGTANAAVDGGGGGEGSGGGSLMFLLPRAFY